MRRALWTGFAVLAGQLVSAQNLVINGDFEVNSATSCEWNVENAQFAAEFPNCIAFGAVPNGSTNGETDVMTAGSCGWGLPAPSGLTKIGIAGHAGGYMDKISMKLSSPLQVGAVYHMSFSAMAVMSPGTDPAGGPVDFGLSTSATDFGTLLGWVTPNFASWSTWSFDFTAPVAATYLTIRGGYWEVTWNHVDDFSVVPADSPWSIVGAGLAGTNGVPKLNGTGTLQPGSFVTTTVTGLRQNTVATLVVGVSTINVPFKGGIWVPSMTLLVAGLPTGAKGVIDLPSTWPLGIPSGFTFYEQYWLKDPAGVAGFAASNAIKGVTP